MNIIGSNKDKSSVANIGSISIDSKGDELYWGSQGNGLALGNIFACPLLISTGDVIPDNQAINPYVLANNTNSTGGVAFESENLYYVGNST